MPGTAEATLEQRPKIHAEFLPNLSLLNIMIPSGLQVNADAIEIKEDSQIHLSDRHRIQLPRSLKWIKWAASDTSLDSSREVTLKIFVDPSHPWLESKDESEMLLDCSLLSSLKQIECAACSTSLLDDQSPVSRFHNTPSEYWHELTDCWACHKEDYSGLKGQKGGIVFAQRDALLVATQYVILHPMNLIAKNLKTEEYKVR
jgi:hypothetical protein